MKLKRHSKTIWFNWAITALVTVTTTVALYLPQFGLDTALTAQMMTGLVLFSTFGNKYLRTLTKDAVK